MIEKWSALKFTSEKEKKEMQNKLEGSIKIIKERRVENKRRVKEKRAVLDSLSKMIERADREMQDEHKHDL